MDNKNEKTHPIDLGASTLEGRKKKKKKKKIGNALQSFHFSHNFYQIYSKLFVNSVENSVILQKRVLDKSKMSLKEFAKRSNCRVLETLMNT